MLLSRYHLKFQEVGSHDANTIQIFSEAAFKNIAKKTLYSETLSEITEPIEFEDILKILSFLNYYFLFKQRQEPFKKYIYLSNDEVNKVSVSKTFSYNAIHNSKKNTFFSFTTIPAPENPREAVDYFPHLFAI